MRDQRLREILEEVYLRGTLSDRTVIGLVTRGRTPTTRDGWWDLAEHLDRVGILSIEEIRPLLNRLDIGVAPVYTTR